MWKYFFIKFWKWKKTYWYFTKNLKIGRNEKLKTGKNELLEKQYKWLVSLQKENLILYKWIKLRNLKNDKKYFNK